MKKLKIIFATIVLFCLTGCFNTDSMEDIKILTSVYPIEYVVDSLYGNHSTIISLYPSDDEIINFDVTDVLLEQYSDNDLFIFNGISDEKSYVKKISKYNNDLKIIDVTSNMNFNSSIEELWLDPNNLLTIANNIKKGFAEYINSTYLINEINNNYDNLKVELTNLDGKYYSASKNAYTNTIIITDDAFAYLKKYGLNIISLDPDTVTSKEYELATEALNNNTCNYIFVKYGEKINDNVQNIINQTDKATLELYTMTNLYNINKEKNNYLTLMNQNLENIKLELYK